MHYKALIISDSCLLGRLWAQVGSCTLTPAEEWHMGNHLDENPHISVKDSEKHKCVNINVLRLCHSSNQWRISQQNCFPQVCESVTTLCASKILPCENIKCSKCFTEIINSTSCLQNCHISCGINLEAVRHWKAPNQTNLILVLLCKVLKLKYLSHQMI